MGSSWGLEWRMEFLMRYFLLVLTLMVSGPVLADETTSVNKMMYSKLEVVSQILRGLVLNDYELVKVGAKKIGDIARANSWHKVDDAEFTGMNDRFIHTAGLLSKRAAEKNIDAVSMQYTNLTLLCISCHKHVRDKQTKTPKK